MGDLTVIGLSIESRQAEAAGNRMLKLLNQLEKQADATVLAFSKIGGGASGVSARLIDASGATARLAGGFNLVRGAAVVAGGALAAFATGLALIVKRGIEINSTLESSTLGIASLIASLNTLKQGDVELKGIDALNAAIPLAEEQMKKLRIAGLETAATTETLVDAFQQALGAGSAAGLTLEQIRNFTIDIVQASTALKIPYQQIAQEVRTILEGTIDQNARIAKALGLTNKLVADFKEQGKLAEELTKRFEVFRASGEKVAKTFAGVTSNAREAFDVFAGAATDRAFNNITNRLQGVIDSVIDTKALDINERLKPVAEFFDTVATGAVTRFFDFVDDAIDLLKDMGDVLRDNRELVTQLGDNFDLVIERVDIVVDKLTSGLGGKGKGILSNLNQEMEDLATLIAAAQDVVELFGSAFLGAIKLIVLGIEGPLNSALRTFGIEIQSLNDDVNRLIKDLDEITARQREGFKNLRETNEKIREAAENAEAVRQFNQLPPESRSKIATFLGNAGFDLAPGANAPGLKDEDPTGLLTGKKTTKIQPKRTATVTKDKEAERGRREAEREAKALAEARIGIQKELADRAFSLEADRLDRELSLLKSSYDQRLVSVGVFFREKSALEQESVRNEISQIDALIAAERKRQAEAEKDSERVKIDKEIIELQTKKILLERELGDVQRNNFDAYLQELAKRATEEKKRREQVADEVAEIQRRQRGERADLLFDQLETGTRRIEIDRELGLITEEEARKRILSLQRESRLELELELERKRKLALLSEDPRSAERYKQELENLRLLGVELDNVTRLKKGLFDDRDTGQLFEDLGRDLRGTIKGAFSDLIKEPENFFRNLVTGFRDALAEMASELLTSSFLRLLRQIFNGTATGGNSGGGGGFLGGLLGFFSNFITGIFGGIKFGGGKGTESIFDLSPGSSAGLFGGGRASGGPVLAGTPYWVGERGPEMFVPPSNGRIVPNNKAGAMAPHISVTVVVQGTRNPREFMESSDQIAAKLIDAIDRGQRLR